ncbi:hypothetical protein AYO38_07100 [bacterium SCGC AG-212-C10]|nr:hypothetical protein AYO38_07100 [bacterium SCGC AG-212-C10]
MHMPTLQPPTHAAFHPLYELTQAVADAQSPEAIYEAALDCLAGALDVKRSSILLFDDSHVMQFVAWRQLSGPYRAAVHGHSPWSPDDPDPKPVLVPDVRLDESLSALLPVIEAEGIRAVAFIPLVLGCRLLGKFMLYYAEPHEFSEGELAAARAIAAHVAFAIQQKRTADEREHLVDRYRTLVESLGLAVYTTDEAGMITLYNEEAVAMWGRRPVLGDDQWCGSWKIFQPDGEPVALSDCPMGIALREGRPVRGQQIVVERPDGTRGTVLPHPTPLRDASGRLRGAVNVLVDITELTRTQSELREALRAKDDFLGMVSHELRNPLTQITGNSELLTRRLHELPDDVQIESLAEINAQAKRMQRLVENMMVLSRFERGVLPDLEPHLIQRLLGETLAEFGRRYPNTQVLTDLPADLPPVETSAGTIDQVVWNLLTNAQKYGPRHGPIEISGRLHNQHIEIVVRDHGPGVLESDMVHLFEPYFRSSTTPEQAAGMGLGLSVCRRLIEAQGGEVWAARRPDGGMEFGLRLRALMS